MRASRGAEGKRGTSLLVWGREGTTDSTEMGSKAGERENATKKKLEGANGTPSKEGALGYGT